MENILISGGAGFIGSNLALKLVKLGYKVTILDNLSSQVHGDEKENSHLFRSVKDKVNFIHGDVRNRNDWQRAIADSSLIVHLAAETGTGQSMYQIEKYVQVNCGGTAIMLDVLANEKHTVNKVVVASSRAIYGEGKYNCELHGEVYPNEREEAQMSNGQFEPICNICKQPLSVLATDEDSKIHPSSVYGITKNDQGVVIETTNKDSKNKIEADVVLISVGRKPYTDKLNLEKIGVNLDKKGKIKVNKNFETNVKNVYAIGDVIDGPMLAHKAEEEGIAVAELIAGQSGHVNYDIIPGVIYTSPEVAYVGKNEEELKEKKINFKVGKFPFMANSRAKAINEPEGFVKILAESTTDRVLGVHIIGPHAGEMIAEMSVAMEFGASSEDIARTCHAHPTFSEAIKEAALSVDKRQIHS